LASELQGDVADLFGAYLLGIDGSNAHRRKKALALEISVSRKRLPPAVKKIQTKFTVMSRP
jgi:hypothetical protein